MYMEVGFMLYVKQSSSSATALTQNNNFKTQTIKETLPGGAIMYVKLYKFGRIAYVQFEATGIVSNKTHKLYNVCPFEFVPIDDIFVSAFQRTAGNNYQSFYGGVVYEIQADGDIRINCENTDYLERYACTSYISKY